VTRIVYSNRYLVLQQLSVNNWLCGSDIWGTEFINESFFLNRSIIAGDPAFCPKDCSPAITRREYCKQHPGDRSCWWDHWRFSCATYHSVRFQERNEYVVLWSSVAAFRQSIWLRKDYSSPFLWRIFIISSGVYSGCAKCAAHTLSNWTRRDIFQIVRSRENHKKS